LNCFTSLELMPPFRRSRPHSTSYKSAAPATAARYRPRRPVAGNMDYRLAVTDARPQFTKWHRANLQATRQRAGFG
jgi:hypothetical protein